MQFAHFPLEGRHHDVSDISSTVQRPQGRASQAGAVALTTRLPPGPRSTLLSTIKFVRNPFGRLLDAARRYGEPFSLPSFVGKFVVTGDPAGVKTILSADPDTYDPVGAQFVEPVLGESSVILASGERHRALRKLETPPFHAARMRTYGELILRVAEEHVGRWPRGRAVPVHHTMEEITLELILRGVFGVDQADKRHAMRKALPAMIAAIDPSFLFFRRLRLRLFGLSPWARFQRRRQRVAALFQEELDARRRDDQSRRDILSMLMAARYDDGSAIPDEDLLAQMITLAIAGYEPTANTLAFALHYIHRDPAVKARLIEELASLPSGPLDPDAAARLPYLDAVISETMRIAPIQPLVGRTLRRGMTLQGYELPPGINVGIGILNVHRRPDLYPEPERFRPERFLERSFTPFEFLPFGGGARRCIGTAFALYSMKLVLAAVMRSHSLRPVNRAPLRLVLMKTIVSPASRIKMEVM
jgi:cytochrome P450 family 110